MLVTVRHTHACDQAVASRLQGQRQYFAVECGFFVIQRLKHRSIPFSDRPCLIILPCTSILCIQRQNSTFCAFRLTSFFGFHTVECPIAVILRFQRHRIQSCCHIEASADCRKQNFLRQRASLSHRKNADRSCHGRVILFFCMERNILLNIFPDPLRLFCKAAFRLLIKISADHAPIAGKLLKKNTRAEKILHENLLRQIPLLTVEMIFQHRCLQILRILQRQRKQQFLPVRVFIFRKEGINFSKILPRTPENLFRFRILCSLFLIKTSRKPCLPKLLSLCHPCCIALLLLLRNNHIPHRNLLRRPDFQRLPRIIRCWNSLLMQHQLQRILIFDAHHRLRPARTIKRPHPDITKTKRHLNFPILVRNQHRRREKLSHIQNLNRHMRSRNRISILILHTDLHQLRSSIKRRVIKVMQRPFLSKVLLITLLHIIREVPRMNQNCPIRRTGEPSGIQHFFRFARTKEMPLPVDKHFNPRMIIITMRPSRCINLPCRNTNTPVRRNRKRRLLPAAPFPAPVHRHRRRRPAVRRLIRRMLRTPVINLQNRLSQRHSSHTLHNLLIEKRSAVRNILRINPVIQHIIHKHILRQLLTPSHILPQHQRMLHIRQENIKPILPRISHRHRPIQKHHQHSLFLTAPCQPFFNNAHHRSQ